MKVNRVTAKCSSCGRSKLVHVVAVFYDQNQFPYCEDCWVVMFCSTITPRSHEDDGESGIGSAGQKG